MNNIVVESKHPINIEQNNDNIQNDNETANETRNWILRLNICKSYNELIIEDPTPENMSEITTQLYIVIDSLNQQNDTKE